MTEAHPLRCETCDNKGFAPDYVTQLNGSEFQCYGGKVVRDLTKERLTLISIVGCASHSSAKSDAVLDELIKRIKIKEDEHWRKASQMENLITATGFCTSAGALDWVLQEIKELRTKEREQG